jgi:hypothetical protein
MIVSVTSDTRRKNGRLNMDWRVLKLDTNVYFYFFLFCNSNRFRMLEVHQCSERTRSCDAKPLNATVREETRSEVL